MGKLEGQVALITGAAGGLGQSLAEGFVREGCRLLLSDLDAPRLSRVIDHLRSQGAAVVRGAPADLRSCDQTTALVERVIQEYGHINILVNNAAVSSMRSLWDLTERDWDEILDVNVKGLFFTLQSAARHMVERGSGSIINIASVAGRVGRPTLLHYAASKAAVISITRSAALALAKQRVRVNAIAPGMIDTEMLHDLQSAWNNMSTAEDKSAHNPSPDKVPLGRVAKPQDIVATAVYLASRDSEYMTGQTLNVCGGLVMS
ncbi:MAG: glucose 1-dehydrogenase [Acidobacteria bacterium]|nr:glucose 1-dehydrogenase [Acidobacteriota bacterium]MCI0722025.1 glucose 1-dehydrogenase [Acidobacteriota bacterium]